MDASCSEQWNVLALPNSAALARLVQHMALYDVTLAAVGGLMLSLMSPFPYFQNENTIRAEIVGLLLDCRQVYPDCLRLGAP